MIGLLRDDWNGYQKIYGNVYFITYNDTVYILGLRVNIFSVMHTMIIGFIKKPQRTISLNKKFTILKCEEHLDHGNGNRYLPTGR